MILTWARAPHEVMVKMAVAINGVRKVFIVNAPRKVASFRNQSRARKHLIAETQDIERG
jgi:hypothetical protein